HRALEAVPVGASKPLGNHDVEVLAEGLGGGEAEELLGGGIPEPDRARGIGTDDGIGELREDRLGRDGRIRRGGGWGVVHAQSCPCPASSRRTATGRGSSRAVAGPRVGRKSTGTRSARVCWSRLSKYACSAPAKSDLRRHEAPSVQFVIDRKST